MRIFRPTAVTAANETFLGTVRDLPVPVVCRQRISGKFWAALPDTTAGITRLPGARLRLCAGFAGGRFPEGTCPKNRKVLSSKGPIDGPARRPGRPIVVKIVDVESLQKTEGLTIEDAKWLKLKAISIGYLPEIPVAQAR